MILIKILGLPESKKDEIMYELSQRFDYKDYPFVPPTWDCGSYSSSATEIDKTLRENYPEVKFQLHNQQAGITKSRLTPIGEYILVCTTHQGTAEALYGRIVSIGPDVKEAQYKIGDPVIFMPGTSVLIQSNWHQLIKPKDILATAPAL